MSDEAAWVCPRCGGDWIFDRNDVVHARTASGPVNNPTGQEIEFDEDGRPSNAVSEDPDLVCGNCEARSTGRFAVRSRRAVPSMAEASPAGSLRRADAKSA